MNLINKALQMIRQAFISKVTDDNDIFPKVEVSYHNKRSEAIRFSPYGLCTNAPLNSNVVLLSINGQESLKYALSDDMQNRYKNLKEGEVILYNYMSGSYTYLKENGDIEVECKKDEKINIVGDATIDVGGDANVTVGGDASVDVTGSLAATAPTINLTGNVTVTGTFNVAGGNAASFSGTLGVTGESTFDGIAFSTHEHTQPDTGADDTVQGDTGGPK